MDPSRKRKFAEDTLHLLAQTVQENGYLRSLPLPCQDVVIQEMRVRDLLRYRVADPSSQFCIDRNYTAVYSVIQKEYPQLAVDIQNRAPEEYVPQIIKMHRVFSKFQADEVLQLGNTHKICRTEGHAAGSIRTLGPHSVFTVRPLKGRTSKIMIRQTVDIEGKDNTEENCNGELLLTTTDYLNHIALHDNSCSISSQPRLYRDKTEGAWDQGTGGLKLIDLTTKDITYNWSEHTYQMHEVSDHLIMALRAAFDVETDLFDLRTGGKPVRTSITVQSPEVNLESVRKCSIKFVNNVTYSVSHRQPGQLRFTVDALAGATFPNIMMIDIDTPDNLDGFTWSIDVQGTYALLAYQAYREPSTTWFKIVLINLSTMAIEQDYSELFEKNFYTYGSAPGIKLHFSIVKLKHDFLILGAQNFILIMRRNDPNVVEWSSRLITDSSFCYRQSDIDYAEGELLLRNCQSFTRLKPEMLP